MTVQKSYFQALPLKMYQSPRHLIAPFLRYIRTPVHPKIFYQLLAGIALWQYTNILQIVAANICVQLALLRRRNKMILWNSIAYKKLCRIFIWYEGHPNQNCLKPHITIIFRYGWKVVTLCGIYTNISGDLLILRR